MQGHRRREPGLWAAGGSGRHNPPMSESSAALPPLCVDALNVAWWAGAPPSLRLPLALLHSLCAGGREARLFFDASARHHFADEVAVYETLQQQPGLCVQVPAGRSADAALLRQARMSGAAIVSRDHYRDHRRRYRKLIDDPARCHGGFVREGVLHVPTLGVQAPLADNAAQALLRLTGASPPPCAR